MKRVLRTAGVDIADELHAGATYHLEVKTTQGSCGDPFFVSQNQVDMVSFGTPTGFFFSFLANFWEDATLSR